MRQHFTQLLFLLISFNIFGSFDLEKFNEEYFSRLERLESHIVPAITSSADWKENRVLTLRQRKILRDELEVFASFVAPYFSKIKKMRLSTSKKKIEEIKAYTTFYAHIVEYLNLASSNEGMFGIVKDLRKEDESFKILNDLLEKVKIQSVRSKNITRGGGNTKTSRLSRSLTNIRNKRMADLLYFRNQFSRKIQDSDIQKSLDKYNEHSGEVFLKIKSFLGGKLLNEFLYKPKSMAMKIFSSIKLKKNNTFDKDEIKQIDKMLEPGDIATVKRWGKLNNLVFKGHWSHGLLYVGDKNELSKYFGYDQETLKYYKGKCAREGFSCQDFSGYLSEKYPQKWQDYSKVKKTKEGGSLPVVIEGLAPGIIFTTAKEAFGSNRVSAFRPKLSKKNKALAIEEAFFNVGKPYDYNFTSHTYKRLVCSELTFYAYMEDPEIGKEGLSWVMSDVLGQPAIYGYDIVKTFFEYGEMDFVLYWESPPGKKPTQKLGVKELEQTITPLD